LALSVLALLQAVVLVESWEVVGRATNGPDAMRLAEEIAPDVAILDYRMPGENGIELAARLRVLRPHTTIIMFSAMNVEAEAMSSGDIDRYVRKGDLNLLRGVLDDLNAAFRSEDDG
jgi:CheY-like chemotaxis protein